jgi:Protein of unknown function (DUF3606)
MAESMSKFEPPDPKRINVRLDHEFRYWTRELKCTPNELRDAVKAVGESVEAVKQHLAKPK